MKEKKKNKRQPQVRGRLKFGRNNKCPCGSGKKFKVCCGKSGTPIRQLNLKDGVIQAPKTYRDLISYKKRKRAAGRRV